MKWVTEKGKHDTKLTINLIINWINNNECDKMANAQCANPVYQTHFMHNFCVHLDVLSLSRLFSEGILGLGVVALQLW